MFAGSVSGFAQERPRGGMSWDVLVQRADADRDGRITREEFKGPPPLFGRLDRDGDGVLTKEDFWEAEGSRPASRGRRAGTPRPASNGPTHANVAYGPHERNVLDLWLAKSDRPTPLAVFIHGGGFIGGSKEQINASELNELLDAGISVAALNYRLLAQAPLPAAHQDVTRAVQFLRSRDGEWNLDKARIGGFGGSAGAQLVMYLAFHDDLADPKSADPVARESSRLACVAPNAGQITMDMKWWDAHVPGYAEKAQRRRDNSELFGTNDEAAAMRINDGISAISLISRDDPPFFMGYGMAPDSAIPTDSTQMNWLIHHVIHGVELKRLCDQLGVEANLKYPGVQTRYASTVEFFKARLRARAVRETTAESTTQPAPKTRPASAAALPAGKAAASALPGPWAEPKAEPDGLMYRTFASKAAGTDVSYAIYLPPDYETAKDERYPVVYWLHGRGGSQTSAGQLAKRLDPAIRSGKAPPMIVVGVNGLKTSSFVDWDNGRVPVQAVIVKELIPHVDATYRTIASREGRAIEGFSMGGAGAPKIGFRYPELFSAVSILAGALHDLDSYKSRNTAFQDIYGGKADYFEANSPWKLVEQNADKIRGKTAVRIVVGGKDGLAGRNTSYHALLDQLKIAHDFTVVPDAPHSPGPLLDGVGDETWAFFKRAFGEAR
jgi:acetyl esterase/lipase